MDDQKSPTPEEAELVVEMDFYLALKSIKEGKKVTRLEWGNSNYYAFMQDDELLTLHKDDNALSQWIISLSDMEGKDWIVIN